ncbi:hypothetical protein RJ55_01251 [Drechmeria coniospora]|nr:hypothetical protein RJ55_01251 [Drechmeria coniospora]
MRLANLAITALGLAYLGFAQTGPRLCGLKIAPCPWDMTCKPDSDTCIDLDLCQGTCVLKNKYPPCGGHGPDAPKCDDQSECFTDPRTGGCGLACGEPGICVPKSHDGCGGFFERPCSKGTFCYDDPRDSCVPIRGKVRCDSICL